MNSTGIQNQFKGFRAVFLSAFLAIVFLFSPRTSGASVCATIIEKNGFGAGFRWRGDVGPGLKASVMGKLGVLERIFQYSGRSIKNLSVPEELKIEFGNSKGNRSCSFNPATNSVHLPHSIPDSFKAAVNGVDTIWLHEVGHAILHQYLVRNSVVVRAHLRWVDRLLTVYRLMQGSGPRREAAFREIDRINSQVPGGIESVFPTKDFVSSYEEVFADAIAWAGTGRLTAVDRAKSGDAPTDSHMVLREASAQIGRDLIQANDAQKRILLDSLAELIAKRLEEGLLRGEFNKIDWAAENDKFYDDFLELATRPAQIPERANRNR